MTDESVFRSIVIINIALALPIGEHTLVTHGPYRWVRHPFYDVIFVWILSMSVLIANWLMALLGFSALAMMVARTRIEEDKLIERFGDDYRSYMERTGRFLPHFR
jgi:protein-S-isoprenylcysteine O-methyltransferase Ste14